MFKTAFVLSTVLNIVMITFLVFQKITSIHIYMSIGTNSIGVTGFVIPHIKVLIVSAWRSG